ncbi:hypothetical protein [Allorhodopirellula heiligendammensis]|nr:hypothetical protein [Allorhodopirellula heiligendammensis]
MTRVSASISDGLATVGDHCFLDLQIIDGPAGFTQKTAAVRVGVCIDGEDHVLATGAGFPNSLQSQLVSPFGMIKEVVGANIPISHFGGLIGREFNPFFEGDYFLAVDDVLIDAGSNGSLSASKGSVYRLVDVFNFDHPDSWQEVSAAEFNDVVFGAGEPHQSTSLLLSDSPQDFSALPGRRVGVKFTGLSDSDSFPGVNVIAGNSVTPSLPLCHLGAPPMQREAVFRSTPFAKYTGSLVGGPASLPFRGYSLPLFGSDYLEGYRYLYGQEFGLPSGGYQFTRNDYFKFGPTGSPDYAWQFLYLKVSVTIRLDITQPRVGFWSAAAFATIELREGLAVENFSLADLKAGVFALKPQPGALFEIPTYPAGPTFGETSQVFGPFPGHYMDDFSATLSPVASGPDPSLAAMVSVYDLTIGVPVPQP